MTTHTRILIVDDNPANHADFREILLGDPGRPGKELQAIPRDQPKPAPAFDLDSAHQGREALRLLTQGRADGRPYALAFVNVRRPPGWDGIETIAHLWQVDPSLQIVACTADSAYSYQKMRDKLGVNDNLVILKKPFDNVEIHQLAHALSRKWHLTQQAQLRLDELDTMVASRTHELQAANAELRRSEERFAKAFRASPIPFAIQGSGAGRFVDVNDAFLSMTGFTREELIGRSPMDLRLCIDYDTRIRSRLREGDPVRNLECEISTRSGDLRHTLVSIERITLAGEPHLLMMLEDISNRLRLESQLRQAQKMEAVGQLAAGIAHDFNNLLTVIQGHSSLQLATGRLDEDATESVRQIALASERAADLTRQLLAFSRRQILRPRVLRLNEVLNDLIEMLRRVIGERIELRCEGVQDLPPIWADQASVEQVIMNLALNARDAMPAGGSITIVTKAVQVRLDATVRNAEAVPGDYICLSVTDTGMGIDEATRARIFDPFFTTKEVNKGTGLGLATVYGITKQHDGWVDVITAPGQGSTFSVFLPVTERVVEAADLPRFLPDRAGPTRTLLIVEDDASVRSLVKEILELHDYRVLEAESADAAHLVWQQHAGEIELLLTDMVMPGSANGLELSRQLLALKPELKVIYSSGYSAELFGSDAELEEGVNYLPKPYLFHQLTAILRQAFEMPDESVSANAA
ncbi:MAG: two-component system, cell cycle sensor histidine kinase and response regulator CckA [Chthoniobacter sp.]|jgi:PAS domain S-box-containing protein|nr:two-component system, cell cycle sensor histidine kinase and response regulator CckA [Chthoniobacter sp.]